MKDTRSKLKAVICVLIAFLVLFIFSYIYDYYRATERAINALEKSYYIEDNTIVFPADNADTGLIFYPGGKVDYRAYAPLLEECAEEGILCVLVRMPGNLAVLDIDAAEGIQEQFKDIERWYLAGHSLGGSMAASYVADHTDEYEGLILLAAYSTADLSTSGMEVLSIYGSEDMVINKEKYEEYKMNLPDGFTEIVIADGNHAYFGDYGEQDGDGIAKITNEEQQNQTIQAIKSLKK